MSHLDTRTHKCVIFQILSVRIRVNHRVLSGPVLNRRAPLVGSRVSARRNSGYAGGAEVSEAG
jgi:hypothetical protein